VTRSLLMFFPQIKRYSKHQYHSRRILLHEISVSVCFYDIVHRLLGLGYAAA